MLYKVSVDSIVHTDAWQGYDGLVDVGFNKHIRINKDEKFSNRKGNHVNGIE